MFRQKLYIPTYLTFFAGCAACLGLRRAGVDVILAAAALGFFITYLRPPGHWAPAQMPTVFAAGTFVGMSSATILPDYVHAGVVSLLGSTLFVAIGPRLNGIGGRLGAIAFVTTAAWLGLRTWPWI